MTVVFLPGFLWTPGDESALAHAGLPTRVVPLTTLVNDVDDVDSDLVPALAAYVEDADVVVGYSMGARVLLCALGRGLRVPAAVLLSLSSTPPSQRAARLALDRQRAADLSDDVVSFVDAWGALPLFQDAAGLPAWQEQQARRRRLSREDVLAHAQTLLRFSAGALVPASPSVFDKPVTLVAGARDAVACDVSMTTAQALPRARVEIVAGCGHVLPLQAPDVVAQIVSATTPRPDAPVSPEPRRAHVAPART
jgi:pimeloyl-ACP methyl ester carboxylesterase